MSYGEQKAYREKRRRRAIEHLGGACVSCGTTENLQFDHIVPDTKIKDISQAVIAGWSWDRLVQELAKCQLLCRTHHLEKSRSEGSLGGTPVNKVLDPEHGASVMYSRGCRCEACRTWKSKYRKGLVDTTGHALVAQ